MDAGAVDGGAGVDGVHWGIGKHEGSGTGYSGVFWGVVGCCVSSILHHIRMAVLGGFRYFSGWGGCRLSECTCWIGRSEIRCRSGWRFGGTGVLGQRYLDAGPGMDEMDEGIL